MALLLVTAAASVMVIASCGAVSPIDETGAELSTPAPPHGLMTRSGTPPYGTGSGQETFMDSAVAQLHWRLLEPTPGNFQWSELDTAVSNLVAAHVSHIRVRVMSGPDAPGWVKRLGSTPGYFNSDFCSPTPALPINCGPMAQKICGNTYQSPADWGGVAIQDPAGQGKIGCVPFFWTTAYQSAYDTLMKALAAKLNSSSTFNVVSSVVDSSCSGIFAEVFYRAHGDASSNLTLLHAGLNFTNDRNCQTAAIYTHQAAFGSTRRTSLAVNPWDEVSNTANQYHDSVWSGGPNNYGTYEFLHDVAIPTLGTALLEIQNNGLHTNSNCSSGTCTTSDFCFISQYPGRRGFQTETYVNSSTLDSDLRNGIAMHADYIELPNGMSNPDWAAMPTYNSQVLANANWAPTTNAACQ